MPRLFFVIAFMIFSAPDLTAQENIMITGKVVDDGTKEELGFASVSIAGKPIGTVTNSNGEFDFYIPSQYINDTLVISHVGYKSFRCKIADMKKVRFVTLKTLSFLLKEVVINEKILTGKEIVSKAIKNLKKNYSTNPFCLEGFFREIEEENGKYVLLTEAALDLCDKNFDGKRKSHLQEFVDVKEMRRSLRYSGQGYRDNIGYALADLLENNDVRYNRGMLDTVMNQFSLDTITSYNDRAVYGVSMSNFSDRGIMYIDVETFGFLKIAMERKSQDPAKKYYDVNTINNEQKRGRVWFKFSVEFEEYMNKLYPRRMHESELNEIHDGKTGLVKIASIETLEFVVNNVIPGRENKDAKKMRYGMTIKNKGYNKDFWENYNTLKLTPINEKLIRDLEKEISLQEQFEKQQ